jgi:ubiquinone/menaquinone biosynthesis C-methylase UbiE
MEEPDKQFNHIQHYKLDGEYYDFFAPDNFMLQEIRRRYQEFFHLYRPKKSDRILEIGSGGGFALESLEGIKPNYYPLDIPLGNLKKIRHKGIFPLFPVCADGYSLPFQSGSIDLVIMSEVLEHIAEPLPVLREITRVLKNGGTYIVSVPYKEKISYQICVHCNKPTPTHSHFHSFDETKLAELIRSAGMEPRKFAKNCNKVPNRLHFNLFLKNLPFAAWKLMDRTFNLLIDKPTSLILVSRKV